jgi:hypothetical protein
MPIYTYMTKKGPKRLTGSGFFRILLAPLAMPTENNTSAVTTAVSCKKIAGI